MFQTQPLNQPTFTTHLIELRRRLFTCLLAILILFAGLFYFAGNIYAYLAIPLLKHLPSGSTMIATSVAAPLLAPLKLTFILAIFLAIPIILYQLWSFIAPGLYKHEKQFIIPLTFISILLFYFGAAFAYFIVFPLVFGFFASVVPKGIQFMPDMSEYLSFTLKLFFAFGFAFEVPIAIMIVTRTGLISTQDLAKKRPYVIVLAFILGMLLTPPDVISQVLLAIPIWFLFEAGLLSAKILSPAQPM